MFPASFEAVSHGQPAQVSSELDNYPMTNKHLLVVIDTQKNNVVVHEKQSSRAHGPQPVGLTPLFF
jgi:hypothetical protein